jgi:Flp pilus assembly secretin CpaC
VALTTLHHSALTKQDYLHRVREEFDMVIRVLLLVSALVVTPAAAQMRIVGGDQTARFVPIEQGKSIVIELPEPVADVLVSRPETANVIMRTATRAYVVASEIGDTSVYFFNAQKQRIDALDIVVRSQPVQTPTPLAPKQVVTVYRGAQVFSLSCTETINLGDGARCYDEPPPRR